MVSIDYRIKVNILSLSTFWLTVVSMVGVMI